MDEHEWDRRYAAHDLLWGAEPNRFVAADLADLPPGRALDLGTGEGRNAIWLAGHGWRVTAVDFSAVGLARAEVLAGSQDVTVEWVLADLRSYQPAARAYDLVLVAYLHVLEAELSPLLRRAAAALAEGGTLYVVGHDRDNVTHGVGGPQDPGRLYTPELISAELAGLQVRRAERRLRPVQTEDGERDAIDTVVIAVRPGRS